MWKLLGNKNSEKKKEAVKNKSEESTKVSSAMMKSDVNFPSSSRTALSTTLTRTERRVITMRASELNFSRTSTLGTTSSNNFFSSEPFSGLNNFFSRDFTRHSFNAPSIHSDSNPFQTNSNSSAIRGSAFSAQPSNNQATSVLPVALTPTNRNIPTPNKERTEKNNNDSLPANKIEKLKIKVKSSTRWCDESDSKVGCYQTRSKKIALLINIKTFINKDERKGSEIDVKNLCSLFTQMGFKVNAPNRKEWTRKDIEYAISSFKSNKRLKEYDVCIVVVMSHGNGGIGSDSTVIVCSNNETVETNWIVTQFDGINCRDLLGKPKIFVFQCCRGAQEYHRQKPATDGPSPQSDILVAYSTVPGFVSYRCKDCGSWYIYTFCKIFMEHAYDTHVEDLLKMVDEELKMFSDNYKDMTKPTTSYESRGFKKCYLHPNPKISKAK
ncbi:caspase-3-like [Agrilus planipennis]|uniref:Caspase-3-like n=1 Tax=Agrilus planipennis TaxID=224129 RepID=A0A1W4WKI9_AGRPL|nr:caspase-3-like [Agrilus planipennis]